MNKRILRLLLCIVLCLSLMPICAFADSGNTTVISEVDITLPALTGGQTVASATPKCIAKAGKDTLENVVFFSAEWEEQQSDGTRTPLANTDTFIANHTYRLTDPMLYPDSGYTFDSNVTVKLNGKEITPTVDADIVYFESQIFVASCTVSFVMNGHGTVPTAQYDDEGRLLEPVPGSDDEYGFAGWFTDTDLTRPMRFPAQLTEDATLYASWKLRVEAIDITVTQAKYTPPGVKLGASYTVDSSTDNTTSAFAQYMCKNGGSWKQIKYNSDIAYDTQNKIEFTVSLTDSDVRMIDELTAVTVNGAEGADSCEIKKADDSVTVTVLYVLPPRKFTVKFDTDGHTPPIPDQEVDALSAVEMPDMSAYTDGAWRFNYWYWGGNTSNFWYDSTAVWDDIVLTADWHHYVKVTFVVSSTGEKIECWYRSDNMLDYWIKELEKDGKYYVREVYTDKNMTQMIHETTHITNDVTLYADAPLNVRELDFMLEEPSDGKTMTPDVRIVHTDPENSVEIEKLGQWYVSDDGNNWRAMKAGETYAGGHFYYYSDMKFKVTDRNKFYFDNPDIIVKRNGNECSWFLYTVGRVGKAYYTLPGTVEFELNGHGNVIPSQEVEPLQKAVCPEDPTETGWQFTGWYTDKECTVLYDFDTPVGGNLSLYAGWDPRVDTVDADFMLPRLHGKADNTVSALTPNHKEANLSASRILWKKNTGSGWTAVKSGEEFLADAEYRAEFTVIADSKIPFDANVRATVQGSGTGVTCSLDASGNLKVIYTKYLEYTDYEVTFDTDGKGNPIDIQTVEEGLTATCPSAPAEEGYVFEGWYADAAHTIPFDFEEPVLKDMTLYAHWQRIIYKVNITLPDIIVGQTVPKKVQLSTEYGKKGLRQYEMQVDWQKDGSRSANPWSGTVRFEAGQNYTIRNFNIILVNNDWILADDPEIVSNFGTVETVSVSGNYAEVKVHVTVANAPAPGGPILLTVTFDTKGRGTVNAQTVPVNGVAAKPDDPAAEGYTFTGWYTDEECTSLYDFDTPVNSNLILYAGWKQASADAPDPDSPQTGDNGNLFLWTAVLFISGAAMSITVCKNRMRKNN